VAFVRGTKHWKIKIQEIHPQIKSHLHVFHIATKIITRFKYHARFNRGICRKRHGVRLQPRLVKKDLLYRL